MSEGFDHLVLASDEFLLLRPRGPLSPDVVDALNRDIPDALHGRVLVVTDQFDVHVVKTL